MKIRFTDTGEIITITKPEQLANTKVRVTPETSRLIQEAALKMGFLWAMRKDIKSPRFLNAAFLFLNNLSLGFAEKEDAGYFETNDNREFEFLSPLSDPETREIATDFEILEEGEAWVKEQDRINGNPKWDKTDEAWYWELKKVNQLPQTQEALNDQLMKLRVIANKFGFYDAADYCTVTKI
jgi:hypothetical protein